MNLPQTIAEYKELGWRCIIQKVLAEGVFGRNADEVQQELLILDDLETQLHSLRANNLLSSKCQQAKVHDVDEGLDSSNFPDEGIQANAVGNPKLSESLDLGSKRHQTRLRELELAVHVSQHRFETLFFKAHERAMLVESSYRQKHLIWEEEKKNLLESVANLTNQIEVLESDYNFLRTRFLNLQKSSRFVDSQIKLRCDAAESRTVDGHFIFELTAWPKEKEQKKLEIQDLRKQLEILSKQSKYQQEQLLLSRKEVDALFRAQATASEENHRLTETVLMAEESQAALERLCIEAASRVSHSKTITERLLVRLAERGFARTLRIVKARPFALWKSSVRSASQLRALCRATRLMAGRRPARVAQEALRAWLQRARRKRLVKDSCRNRKVADIYSAVCAWRRHMKAVQSAGHFSTLRREAVLGTFINASAEMSQQRASVGLAQVDFYEKRRCISTLNGNLKQWLSWLSWRKRMRAILRARAERASRIALARTFFCISQHAASANAARSAAIGLSMQRGRPLLAECFCKWTLRAHQISALARMVTAACRRERSSIFQARPNLCMQIKHGSAACAAAGTALDGMQVQYVQELQQPNLDSFLVPGPLALAPNEDQSTEISDACSCQQRSSTNGLSSDEEGPRSSCALGMGSFLISEPIMQNRCGSVDVLLCSIPGSCETQLQVSPALPKFFRRSDTAQTRTCTGTDIPTNSSCKLQSSWSRNRSNSLLSDDMNERRGVCSKVCSTAAAFYKWKGFVMLHSFLEKGSAISLNDRIQKFIFAGRVRLGAPFLFTNWCAVTQNKIQKHKMVLGLVRKALFGASLNAFLCLREYGRRSCVQKKKLSCAVRLFTRMRITACFQAWTSCAPEKYQELLLTKVVTVFQNRRLLAVKYSLWRNCIVPHRVALQQSRIWERILTRQSKHTLLQKAFMGLCSCVSNLHSVHTSGAFPKFLLVCCKCLHLWRMILFHNSKFACFENVLKVKDKKYQKYLAWNVLQQWYRWQASLQTESFLMLQGVKRLNKRIASVFLAWNDVAVSFRKVLSKLSLFYYQSRRRKLLMCLQGWNLRVTVAKIGYCCIFMVQKVSKHRLGLQLMRQFCVVWKKISDSKILTKRVFTVMSRKRNVKELIKILHCWGRQILYCRSLVVAVASLRFRHLLLSLNACYQAWKIYLLSVASLRRHCVHRLHLKLYRCFVNWRRIVHNTNLQLLISERQNLFMIVKKRQRDRWVIKQTFWILSESVWSRRPGMWMVCEVRGPTLLRQFQVQRICLVNRQSSNITPIFEQWKCKVIDALIAKKVLKYISATRQGRNFLCTLFSVFYNWRQEYMHCRLMAIERGHILKLHSLLCELLEVYGEPLFATFQRARENLCSTIDLIAALNGFKTRLCEMKQVSETQGTLPPRVINYGLQPYSHLITTLGIRK